MDKVATMLVNREVTMSSKEVAELTSKQHKHVLRDIKEMIVALYGDGPTLDHEQIQGVTEIKDDRGYTAEFRLDREHSLTLVTGYDVKRRGFFEVKTGETNGRVWNQTRFTAKGIEWLSRKVA